MKYKNVASWGNTSRYQFRLRALGEVFFGFDFATPKEAAFVCDVCKSVLLAFGCLLDKRTKPALSEEEFASCCRSHGLDPLNPILNAGWKELPEKFREYIQSNRPTWEKNLRSGPSDPYHYLRYACSSEDPNVRNWAWAYKFALHKKQQLDSAPLGWWNNLMSSIHKSRDTVHRYITPSVRKHFSEEHNPRVLLALDELRTASETMSEAVKTFNAEVSNAELDLQLEFRQLESTRPDVLRSV
jgi:hypothetical protein